MVAQDLADGRVVVEQASGSARRRKALRRPEKTRDALAAGERALVSRSRIQYPYQHTGLTWAATAVACGAGERPRPGEVERHG